MKILFLIPYPLKEAPSQRFRFEQYIELLSEKGFNVQFQSFLDSHNWHFFFKSGNFFKKVGALARGFLKRFFILFKISRYSLVFIHREATPIGPPIVEWIISKVFKKKIIYDFDDAIWLTDRQNEGVFLRTMKWRSKVRSICRWSYKVSCGNNYLADYARQFSAQVVHNPTTIDTESLHNPNLFPSTIQKKNIVIGWTGSHSTLKYLVDIETILKKITDRHTNVNILVIADRAPGLSLKELIFIPWSSDNEMIDLLKMDIGIMPLPNDEWSKGKCGFKALQYMAMKIPTVASPVGVNTTIIDQGINGYLCATEEEWIDTLEMLINNAALRREIGEYARKKVVTNYSTRSNSSTFLSLFE